MDLDLSLLKKHPYATGGAVIVGGVVLFYLMSGSQGSEQSTSSGSGVDYSSLYAADAQLAQVQAAAQVQTNAQQVQLAQSQLEAAVSNYQTDASLEATKVTTAAQLAATLAQLQSESTRDANQYAYALQIQQMQDQVLMSQINAGVLENANNNATALGATQIAADVSRYSIDAAAVLAQQKEADYQANVQAIIPQAGKSYNTANDANRATTLFSQILAGGDPSAVIVNQNAQAAQNIATTTSTASIINSIAQGLLR